MLSKSSSSTDVLTINQTHSLTAAEEQQRIEKSGGIVSMYQIVPYVPPIPRVFANKECTRGGLAMSRSIGDELIHRYGVISDPTFEILDFQQSANHDVILLFGSDGFLSYMEKSKIVGYFKSGEDLGDCLSHALQAAQTYLLELTGKKYADDTSGVAVCLYSKILKSSRVVAEWIVCCTQLFNLT